MYGEQQPQQPQQQQLPPATDHDSKDDYYYEGDAWGKAKYNGDQAAQVREAIFGLDLPTEDNFMEWFPVLRSAIDMVARIPGYDAQIYAELNRDMEDLVDRSNSQGRRKIIASKMEKFIFRLRSLIPKGDVTLQGVTGVTAMITTNTNQKQEVRVPTQHAPESIFSGASRMLGRK